MEDDPILLGLTAFFLVVIPAISYRVGKINYKKVFFLPILAMGIAFPMFMFIIVVPDTPYAMYFFYASMSLWAGGFFGFFFSWGFYIHGRKRKYKK